MRERTIAIEPRDPAIFRDGRPFSLGLPATTQSWPPPSAIIGAIRTRLGRIRGYDEDTIRRLLRIEQIGPFLAAGKPGHRTLAFPAPADAVAFEADQEDQLEIFPLRPESLRPFEGTDLPSGLVPVAGGRDEKAAKTPLFWTAAMTLEWLSHTGAEPMRKKRSEIGHESSIRRQRRVHVEIEPGSQSAKRGMLFGTEGLEFEEAAICSRIRHEEEEKWPELERLAPVGGERRLAYWAEEEVPWPAAPDRLAGARLVRLQLITPGRFDAGWRPHWMSHGHPPGAEGLELKLAAAAVPRATPISGWDLKRGGDQGQKATRFLAPAGSVYFCEVRAGDPRQLWMRPIADNEQDRRDGFGLVLCGEWTWR